MAVAATHGRRKVGRLLLLKEHLTLGLLVLLFNLDELFLENLDLLCILSEKSVFGIFIYFRLVFYSFSPVSISQGAQCFLIAGLGWGDIGDHASLHVPTEGVLQQSGQFRVTIRNVSAPAIDKTRNDIHKGRE